MFDNGAIKRGEIAAYRRMSWPQVVVFGGGALVGRPWCLGSAV
jgi:hypothetical protein